MCSRLALRGLSQAGILGQAEKKFLEIKYRKISLVRTSVEITEKLHPEDFGHH